MKAIMGAEVAKREERQRMPSSPGVRIGRILGIPIYVHASWVIIFVLITMSLAMQFTQEHPQWSTVQHWAVGIATSLLFFASVVFPGDDLNEKAINFLLNYPELIDAVNPIEGIKDRSAGDRSAIRCEKEVHGAPLNLLQQRQSSPATTSL